ncbi:aldo/keto reductase [Sorangium sp. So ce260]|uniref:aldo/keto reductase n=1 Tax=Sorangium sp. So ce260 TaxID=3133291 RepID=UPI003F5FDE0C
MEKRRIGSLEVSVVGLGCNNFGGRIDEQRTAAVVDAALDAGINFFDTADVYGGTRSEELLGRALGGRRSSVIIATKFGVPLDDERRGGARPAYIQRAVEDSLRRLGTDWIDLYQLHRPDPETPIEDTLEALDALVRAGKVREIGSSNVSAAQIRGAEEAVRPGGARFVSVQNEYSLLQREPEQDVLAESKRRGIAFLPYFPLASGLLSGKYRTDGPAPAGARLAAPDAPLTARFLTDRNRQTAAALGAYATSRGRTLLELAFSWLASRPAVASVIAGATSPEQVRANAAAVGFRLTGADLEEIDRLAPPPARAPGR